MPASVTPIDGLDVVDPEKLWLTAREVCDAIAVNPSTMRSWLRRGQGPPHYRVGGRLVRFRRDEVEAWLQKKHREG